MTMNDEETTTTETYVDFDPMILSDELQALIRQGESMMNQSAELLKETKEMNETAVQIAELQRLAAESDNMEIGGIVAAVAALGILCGVLITLFFKGH